MKRLAVLLCLVVPGLAWAKKAPSLPVMEVAAQNGADQRLAILATDSVAESLRDLNVFKIVSSEDIKKILSFQREKALASGGQCSEDSCLAELGGALGADYMVSGKLTKIGGALKLDLQLFNNAKAKVESAASQDNITGEKALVDAAKVLARRVVAPLLDKHSGQLFVNVSDPGAAGATIDIDGRTVGTTLPPSIQSAPVQLGWGPHHVIVKKEGFVTFEKDVQIDEGQSTTLPVTLVPSPDFIDAYKGRNSKLRWGSYGLGIAAVGLAGASTYFNMRNIDQYKVHANALWEQEHPEAAGGGAASDHSSRPYATVGGCDVLMNSDKAKTWGTSSSSCNDALNKSATSGSNQLHLVEGLAAGAAVAAVGGAVLYLLSDDPHRYDGFIQSNPGEASPAAEPAKTSSLLRRLNPEVGVLPLPDGAFASLGVHF